MYSKKTYPFFFLNYDTRAKKKKALSHTQSVCDKASVSIKISFFKIKIDKIPLEDQICYTKD